MTARVLRLALAAAVAFAVATAGAEEIVQPADRDVSPPGVMPLPAGNGPLIREPAPPKPPDPPRWRRYFLPQTTDAATFSVKGTAIRIAGVTPPSASDICPSADDAAWPCGQTALYALRRFLHGRAVECFFPYAESAADVIAPCRVGDTDLGLWLLTAGWARPSNLATDAYVAAATTARCARVGMWREATAPKDCPAQGPAKS